MQGGVKSAGFAGKEVPLDVRAGRTIANGYASNTTPWAVAFRLRIGFPNTQLSNRGLYFLGEEPFLYGPAVHVSGPRMP